MSGKGCIYTVYVVVLAVCSLSEVKVHQALITHSLSVRAYERSLHFCLKFLYLHTADHRNEEQNTNETKKKNKSK